jgi:hypothetical protein
MPFSADPHYNINPQYVAQNPAALAPSWFKDGEWISLAALSDGLESTLEVEEDAPRMQAFRLCFQYGQEGILVQVCLTEDRASINCSAPGAEKLRFTIPLLHTNGICSPEIQFGAEGFSLLHMGAQYRVQWQSGIRVKLHPAPVANRNGLYRLLELEKTGSAISITIELKETK